MWDPPSTAGVLSNLYYRVTLINKASSELILNKTTDNTYSLLTGLQPCQYYTANVTAFSSEYHGDSAGSKQRVPGGVCVCVCVCACVCNHLMTSTSSHVPQPLLRVLQYAEYVTICCF